MSVHDTANIMLATVPLLLPTVPLLLPTVTHSDGSISAYLRFLLVLVVFFFFLHAMIVLPPSLGLVDSGKLLFHGGADFTFLRRRPMRGYHSQRHSRVRFVGNRVFFCPGSANEVAFMRFRVSALGCTPAPLHSPPALMLYPLRWSVA